MKAVALLKSYVPAPAYRLAREVGLSALGSVVGADVGQAPLVALTFDDGPGPATPAILDTLARYQARATFFLLGRNVNAHPDTARAIVKAGHEVGNHTFSHPALPTLAGAERRREIGAGRDAILEVTGVAPQLLRPPYGFQDLPSYVGARRAGYRIIGWSLVGQDWDGAPPDVIAGRLGDAAPGDIVLLHDASPLPEGDPLGDRRATAAALALVLERFRERGLRSVTVSQLLAAGLPRRKLWFRRGAPDRRDATVP